MFSLSVSVCANEMVNEGRKWQLTKEPDSASSSPKSLRTGGLGKALCIVQFCTFFCFLFLTFLDAPYGHFSMVASPPQGSSGLQSHLSMRERREKKEERERIPGRCHVASYDLASEVMQYHFCNVLLVEIIAVVHQVQGEGT